MATNERIVQAAETLHRVLESLGWEPEQIEGDSIYSVDLGPPHLPVSSAVAAIIRPQGILAVYFNLGLIAPPERRDDVATMLALVNDELLVGEFVMDYDDGHVRCRTSVDFAGDELSETIVRNTIAAGMRAVETYASAIVDVIRDVDPHEAFAATEG